MTTTGSRPGIRPVGGMTIERALEIADSAHGAAARERRALAIESIRLRGLGSTNVQIGQQFGVDEKVIGRAVRDYKAGRL